MDAVPRAADPVPDGTAATPEPESLFPTQHRSVFVENLSPTLSRDDVLALLGACGKIVDLRLLPDPHNAKQFACVEFESTSGAYTAASLTGTPVLGDTLSVRLYGPPQPLVYLLPVTPTAFLPMPTDTNNNTIYVGNLSKEITPEQLVLFFQMAGHVLCARVAGQEAANARFGFVEFANPTDAAKALALNGSMMGGTPIRVGRSRGSVARVNVPSAASILAPDPMAKVREAQATLAAKFGQASPAPDASPATTATAATGTSTATPAKRSRSRSPAAALAVGAPPPSPLACS
ncbi:putative Polyadenylate-binding protein [Paratrimastix pyriformis]|uniref:Polyadenylate-binding protein n=1 Tax=Paratrimastix pyriformis TaxID=342808 RepID=A0ABQ8US90_9EUKA|nr:putative Polyadenylate-binding protein [Paratrimastix pyriformis]